VRTTAIVIALLIVAAAIAFHAWYPEHKAEQREAEKQRAWDECMERRRQTNPGHALYYHAQQCADELGRGNIE